MDAEYSALKTELDRAWERWHNTGNGAALDKAWEAWARMKLRRSDAEWARVVARRQTGS